MMSPRPVPPSRLSTRALVCKAPEGEAGLEPRPAPVQPPFRLRSPSRPPRCCPEKPPASRSRERGSQARAGRPAWVGVKTACSTPCPPASGATVPASPLFLLSSHTLGWPLMTSDFVITPRAHPQLHRTTSQLRDLGRDPAPPGSVPWGP